MRCSSALVIASSLQYHSRVNIHDIIIIRRHTSLSMLDLTY